MARPTEGTMGAGGAEGSGTTPDVEGMHRPASDEDSTRSVSDASGVDFVSRKGWSTRVGQAEVARTCNAGRFGTIGACKKSSARARDGGGEVCEAKGKIDSLKTT